MTDSNGNGSKTFLMQAMLALCMFLGGALLTWSLARIGVLEVKQETARDAAASMKSDIRILDGRVEYLEGGKRIRFDLQVDRDLLKQQIEDEVKRQKENEP